MKRERELLRTVIAYYLSDFDTEVSNFSIKLGKDKNCYSFIVHPNPNTNISVLTEDENIKMSIVVDKTAHNLYVQIGDYKEVIADYEFKNIKRDFFTRKYSIDNQQTASNKIYKFIEETYKFIRHPLEKTAADEPGVMAEMMPETDMNYADATDVIDESYDDEM